MKTKKHIIKIENPQPTHTQLHDLLMNLSQAKLNDQARRFGSPVKKYKHDTAEALSAIIVECQRNVTLSLTFTR